MWRSENKLKQILSVQYGRVRLNRSQQLMIAMMDMEAFEYESPSGLLHFFIPITIEALVDMALYVFQGANQNWYMQMMNDIPRLSKHATTTATGDEDFYFTQEQINLFKEENPVDDIDDTINPLGEAKLLNNIQIALYLNVIPNMW